MSIIAILAIPLLAAILSFLPWRRFPSAVTFFACLAVLVLTIRVAIQASCGVPVVVAPKWIAVDGLSALILLLIAFVGTTAALYSLGYMAKTCHEPKKLRLYYANYNLFIFSMLAIPVLVEPTLVWIAVGLTTVCSAMLVSFENTRGALEAAWKYVVLSLMGAAIALLGFLMLFAALQAAGGGTDTWEGLIAAAPRMHAILLKTAFVLILVGLGTKVGLVPMHTWLPDAHSQAPSPVCALLSGIETTAVLYVILRLFPIMKAVPDFHAGTWAIAFGLISTGTAVLLLLRVRDYKRMFAFSTVEHMGIILFAAGLGSATAHYGAFYQAFSHTLTKSFCFFTAGALIISTGTREIASIKGLIRNSPVAGVCLLLSGLAISGAPPFAVFLGEFTIFKAGLAEGRYLEIILLAVFVAIGFFAIMWHINRMVFTTDKGDPPQKIRLPASCLVVLVISSLLVLAFGLYVPAFLQDLLRLSAAAIGR
jgi:hydrogenase-4 component F